MYHEWVKLNILMAALSCINVGTWTESIHGIDYIIEIMSFQHVDQQ